jgi:outer membrane autotransporter protein
VQSAIRTDAFKTINNTPEVLSLVFKSGMNSLNRRLGDIRRTPEDSYSGVWARGFGKSYDVTNEIKTKVDIFGVEGGYDFRVKKDSEDRYYLGLMVGYQSVGSIKTQQTNGGSDGHGDGSAPSFGAYGSWIGKNGYFVDLALRYFMIDLNMTSYSRQDDEINYKPKANYIGFSGEFGKEFEFDVSENKLRVEPKIEMIFGTAGSQSMETTSGEKLEYGGTTVLNGKLKVAGSYQFELQNEMLIEPIIELGYGTEMAGKTDITYGKGKYTSDFSGGYFEVSGGVNAYLTKGFSAYSLVTLESGDNQSNIGWNIGVRYGFGGSKQIEQYGDKNKEKEKREKLREKERKAKIKEREKKQKEREKERTNFNKNKKGTKSSKEQDMEKWQIKKKTVKAEDEGIDTSEIEKVIIRKTSVREVTVDGRIEEKELESRNKVEANELTQGQKKYIIELAKGLANEEIEGIGIAGYVVDISGDENENRKNSVIKAKRVKQILMKLGIDGDKIKVRGYGSKKPVASNKNKEGRIKNDRIEIFIKR